MNKQLFNLIEEFEGFVTDRDNTAATLQFERRTGHDFIARANVIKGVNAYNRTRNELCFTVRVYW